MEQTEPMDLVKCTDSKSHIVTLKGQNFKCKKQLRILLFSQFTIFFDGGGMALHMLCVWRSERIWGEMVYSSHHVVLRIRNWILDNSGCHAEQRYHQSDRNLKSKQRMGIKVVEKKFSSLENEDQIFCLLEKSRVFIKRVYWRKMEF